MKPIQKKILAAVILLAGSLGIVLFLTAGNQKATKSFFAMDTYMDITAYGPNGKEAVTNAEKEILRLDELFSTGNAESEVSALNRQKQGTLSKDYNYLFTHSMELWKETEGAFDVTVYPLMKAWGFAGKNYRVPDNDEIKQLLISVDASKIIYDEETGHILLPENTEIDFGGIAKGYASMRVAEMMRIHKVKSAIINLGGNVITVGKKPDGEKWKVAIKSPDDKLPYLGILAVSDKAVITSGGYERFFEEDGKIYQHIIDPKTGYPVENGMVSVTIISEDATLADGLSTALYVMGREKAVEYWRKKGKAFEFVLYENSGRMFVSEGIADSLSTDLNYEIIRR